MKLNNFFIGEDSVFDYSGQYTIDSLNVVGNEIIARLNISSNSDLVSTYRGQTPLFNDPSNSTSMLRNKPYFSLNKGYNIKITRVSNSNVLSERYQINISDLK